MVGPSHFSVACILLAGLASSRFCPRESRDGFECRASKDPAQFKCGIFYNNLLGDNEIKWIGAMPDAIETVRRKDPNLINEVFPKDEQGNAVSEPYFLYKERSCDQQDANSKCYLLMDQIKQNKLDSCQKTIGNLEGLDTIGNQLCDQALRFKKSDGQDVSQGLENQILTFYYSYCNSTWTPVESTSSGILNLSEPLCCSADGKFRRCDGSDFRREC